VPFVSAPLNPREAIVDERRRPTRSFIEWATSLIEDVDAAPARVIRASVTGQIASIGATPLATAALAEGWYRVTVYARVTTAAATSSSLIPTITHTDSGISCSQSGDAMTSNVATLPKSWTFLVYSDGAAPISYSTTYASVGVPAMAYRLDVILEQLDA